MFDYVDLGKCLFGLEWIERIHDMHVSSSNIKHALTCYTCFQSQQAYVQ